MNPKTILIAALLVVAISGIGAVPVPEEEFEVMELSEIPPAEHVHIRTLCIDDPSCDKEEDEKEAAAEKEHMKELDDWISRMGPKTKAHWREDNKDTAKTYDYYHAKY